MALALMGCLAIWCAAISRVLYSLQSTITKIKVSADIFNSTLGQNVATALKAMDDRSGMDVILDDYKAHSERWTLDQWTELKTRCEAVVANEQAHTEDRRNAGTLAAVCAREMSVRFAWRPAAVVPEGKTPPLTP
jgi:hypothetical protein